MTIGKKEFTLDFGSNRLSTVRSKPAKVKKPESDQTLLKFNGFNKYVNVENKGKIQGIIISFKTVWNDNMFFCVGEDFVKLRSSLKSAINMFKTTKAEKKRILSSF